MDMALGFYHAWLEERRLAEFHATPTDRGLLVRFL
jgi:hypothetical protein